MTHNSVSKPSKFDQKAGNENVNPVHVTTFHTHNMTEHTTICALSRALRRI